MATEIITGFGQQCDANGVPISGALVYVYDVTTTTPKALFSDTGLSVSAANPIVCDSSGRHDMRYIATGSYKIVVKTSALAPVYSRDNIDGRVPVGSGALAIANGGTSSTTAPGALAALGAATAVEVADLASEVAAVSGAQASTAKTHIATGTTAQRDPVPIEGDIRRNTTTTKYEGYVADWDNFMFETASATAIADVKAETAQATYIRPDRLKQSDRVAKAWARVAYSGGAPSYSDSFNFSGSITDTGTGDFTVSFTTALPNANYCAVATVQGTGGLIATIHTATTTTIRVQIFSDSGVAVDPTSVSLLVFGDFV